MLMHRLGVRIKQNTTYDCALKWFLIIKCKMLSRTHAALLSTPPGGSDMGEIK